MDYNKIWSLMNENNLKQSGMSRLLRMSQTGFKQMMDRKTMSVEVLEAISNHFGKPMHYFFDEPVSKVSEPRVSYEKKPPGERDVRLCSCPDCIAKQKEIDALNKALEAKEELLEMYREKKSEGKCG
ncbi:MAG: hypothetical protein ACK5JD_06175 [Mangrovibacterium sp.]